MRGPRRHSWLSEGLGAIGIHVSTPDAIKKLGDAAGGFLVNSIPGGNTVNSIFDLTNTRGGGPSPQSLGEATWANVQTNAKVAVQGALTAVAINNGAKNAVNDATVGLQLLFRSPLGLAGIAVVVVLLLRRS
jgi:hypothetical protein